MTRVQLAFVVAPLWVPLALWGFASLGSYPTPGDWPLLIAAVSTMCAYIGVLVIGLPAFLLMRAERWTASWMAAVAGLLAGLVISYTALVVVCLLRGPHFVNWTALRDALDVQFLSVSAVVGALVSITLWLIARPDRHAVPRN